MESAFAWIQQLWTFITSLIPHLALMQKNYGGVKFKRGGKVKEIKPGLYWWWPIITNVEEIPTKQQTIRLESQSLTTKDDISVTTSLIVVYNITDVVTAIVDVDVEDVIGDTALFSAVEVVTPKTFEECKTELASKIPKLLKQKCHRDLSKIGVSVKKAFLCDFAETTVYSVMGGAGQIMPSGDSE